MPFSVAITFATPLGLLVALGGILPLAALVRARRRRQAVGSALGLAQPGLGAELPLALAFAVLAALIGLAAAQPSIVRKAERPARTDAQAFFVLDVSRSMLASRGPGETTRMDRAKSLAESLRHRLPGVPVGLASLTDQTLPHLFPTVHGETFERTLERALAAGRPAAAQGFGGLATALDTLIDVPAKNYFAATARRRLIVVLTDGESVAPLVDLTFTREFRRPPGVGTLLVQVGRPGEDVYLPNGNRDPDYEPVAGSRAIVEQLARATGGRAFGEDELSSVAGEARRYLGRGPTVLSTRTDRSTPLSPYVALAGVVPLALILRRRNLR